MRIPFKLDGEGDSAKEAVLGVSVIRGYWADRQNRLFVKS